MGQINKSGGDVVRTSHLSALQVHRFQLVRGFIAGMLTGAMCTVAVTCSALLVYVAYSSLGGATAFGAISGFGGGSNFSDPTEFVARGVGANEDDSARQRPVGEIRRDVKAFVKNSKQNDDLSLQVGAIFDLCELHREIVLDSRFRTNDQFKGFRAQVASRLKKYLRELDVISKRRARAAKQAEVAARREARRLGTDAAGIEQPVVNNQRGTGDGGDNDNWDYEMNQSVYDMGSVVGGPTQLFGYLGGNFAPPWDYGEDLVNLIESTIDPKSWQSNGGEGRIQYYRPSMIIVVSASMRVQDEMTDVLRKLRFLSR